MKNSRWVSCRSSKNKCMYKTFCFPLFANTYIEAFIVWIRLLYTTFWNILMTWFFENCMCMCTCTRMQAFTCIRHTHQITHIDMQTDRQTHTHCSTYTCAHTHTYTHTHIYVHTFGAAQYCCAIFSCVQQDPCWLQEEGFMISCVAVNDPFVMEAWGKFTKAEGKVGMNFFWSTVVSLICHSEEHTLPVGSVCVMCLQVGFRKSHKY